jgi:hypothetical protein
MMSRVIKVIITCFLIIAVLLVTLTSIPAAVPASAATSTSADSQGEQGQAYLFHDPVRGTQLYVNTESQVYRFWSPDGYDTGTVRAAQVHITPGIVIQINDFSQGFNFNCNINFKANRCFGYLTDRDKYHGGRYCINAPTTGAKLVENAVVPATTVVLGETTLDCLSWASEDFSTLSFENVTRQLSSLSVGDVIASGVSEATPYGLLRKVVNVVSHGNQMTVETAAATLEDAIEDCNVGGTWSLLPDGSAVPLGIMTSGACQNCTLSSDTNIQLDSVGGTKSMASTESCTGWYIDIDNVVLFDADGDLSTKDDQIVASGSLCADIHLDFGLTIEDWAVEEAHFSVTTTETAQLEVGLKVTIAEFHEKIELCRQYLNPIVLWVGWVPVVITPLLTFNVGVDAEVSAGITASITEIADVTAGVAYDAGTWSPVTDLSTSFDWEPPTLTAGCEVKGYVGPQLSLLLYGSVGPYGEIRGYLELDADLFKTPWWELYGGLEADVGFRVEVLGHDIVDYEVPMTIGYRVLLAQAESPPPNPVVTFPDPNLEAAIREAIGKPSGPIYASDLVGLDTLFACNRSITNLTGIEYCTSLTVLDLRYNQISDLSPLSGLTSLTGLILESNQISDLSPLSGLTSLTVLALDWNQISDLSPLSDLSSLTELYLDWNQISDLSPLSDLTSLIWLSLWSNQISDLSPLSGLTSLTGLILEYNQISDLSPLSGLTSLTGLTLESNQISDLSPLSGLTSLTGLILEYNQISDLSPLSGLTNLTVLDLRYNQISDLSPLSDLGSLTELYLGWNQISDIKPLVDNTGLGYGDFVFLNSNPLSATSVTVYIPQLQERGVYVEW